LLISRFIRDNVISVNDEERGDLLARLPLTVAWKDLDNICGMYARPGGNEIEFCNSISVFVHVFSFQSQYFSFIEILLILVRVSPFLLISNFRRVFNAFFWVIHRRL
jgi:hypothetical protein